MPADPADDTACEAVALDADAAQVQTVTWAGDPHKVVVGNDPLELSPRRSFAAWSEIVRGTARPWTTVDVALAQALGRAARQ